MNCEICIHHLMEITLLRVTNLSMLILPIWLMEEFIVGFSLLGGGRMCVLQLDSELILIWECHH